MTEGIGHVVAAVASASLPRVCKNQDGTTVAEATAKLLVKNNA